VSVYEKNDDAISRRYTRNPDESPNEKISKWPRETTALPRDASAQSIERRLKRGNQTYFRSIQPLSPPSKRPIDTNRAHFEPKNRTRPTKRGLLSALFLYRRTKPRRAILANDAGKNPHARTLKRNVLSSFAPRLEFTARGASLVERVATDTHCYL